MNQRDTTDLAATILAVALGVVFIMLGFAVLFETVTSDEPSVLGEHAANVLTALGSGVIGILGAYVGFRIHHNGTVVDHDGPMDLESTDEEARTR